MRTAESCVVFEDIGFEEIAKRVATARTRDDLFELLGQVAQHFVDHEDGIVQNHSTRGAAAVEGLFATLHNALLLRDGSKRRYYRASLSHSRALQCTVLVVSVEMMLRCSADELAGHKELFREELVPSIPKLLMLFISWEGGETEMIRCISISSSIKILRRIGVVCQEATDTFIESLLMVLRGYIAGAPEIHVEAASAIAHIFDHQDRTARRKRVIEQIQGDSSLIISTLSTAALASNPDDADEILTGLFNFAVNSHTFRTKMAKRRCTILAIGKHLSSNHVENRKLSLNICKCLLNDNMPATVDPVRLDGNQELLLSQILDSALNEREITLQLYAISLLGDAVRNANLQPSMNDTIMDTLKYLVDSDGHDDVVMEASVTYAKAATAIQPPEEIQKYLADVADFTTLPFARTRTTAIGAIDSFISHDELASSLLLETEMLENFALILSYGSTSDGVDAIKICRRLAKNSSYHSNLCQSSSFLHALVKVVTQEDVIDQTCYAGAIQTLLPLIYNNTQCFLPFPDLLPVLVSLANTVSDEELKQRLVKAIVALSSALLG